MGRATRGAIAAGDPQTAEAGAEILRAGGNAVDAVCAAAFAAFVVEPPLCSPAGGGAILFGDPASGFKVLDFFAAAPGLGLGDEPRSLDFHAVDVSFGPTVQQFHVGRGAAAIPGALPGLLQAHRRGGCLPLGEVIAPAIALAREGYVLSPGIHFVIEILRPILALTPGVQTIFGVDGSAPAAGSRLGNPPLADFLQRLVHEGDSLLRGDFLDAVLDAFGPARGGLVTKRDLESYRPRLVEPLRVPLGPHVVLTNPPPSSGGALVCLGLLLAQDVLPTETGAFCGPRYVREMAEILRALSIARSRGYDTQVREPEAAARLFSTEALASLRAAHQELRGEHGLGGTTHISVLDANGEAASLTMSNGEGCGHALEAFGIHMNNFLGEEDINPEGFHRTKPGHRMTTMMAPTIVLRDGRPVLVLGSGGSNRIRSAILQVLLARTLCGRTLAEAVEAPRLHVEADHLWYEAAGMGSASDDALLETWPQATRFDGRNMFFGGVHAVGLDDDETIVVVGDPRRGGAYQEV